MNIYHFIRRRTKQIFIAAGALVAIVAAAFFFLNPVYAASLALTGRALSSATGGYLNFSATYNAQRPRQLADGEI